MKNIKNILTVGIMGASLLTAASCGKNAGTEMSGMSTESKTAAVKVNYKPYPFDTDMASGARLGANAIAFIQDGYEVKVSNAEDEAAVKKSPGEFLDKIKAAYANAKPYPLDKCLVCGMKLDDDDITFVYLGRQFKVCGGDEDCFQVFQKDPAKYVKMWDEAVNANQSGTK
jgi:hypothetical protein